MLPGETIAHPSPPARPVSSGRRPKDGAKNKYILMADYPAPWREKVYELVHQHFGDAFHVVYCTSKESRRLWKFHQGLHQKTFLPTLTLRRGEWERFFSPGIVPFLIRNRPRVLIGFSLYPTVLLGLAIGRLLKSRLVVFADTWLGRDRDISRVQRATRRIVYSGADAFLGASQQTLRMFKHYRSGLQDDQLFLSSLCGDNELFYESVNTNHARRNYDLVFSGRIAAEKNPVFFAEVAAKLKARLGSCRVLVLGDGDGDLKERMLVVLSKDGVAFDAPGFIEHAELPKYYAQGKVLLFPTSGDCWGVVINEAMLCGLPVLTTRWTAAAGELVRDGENGYILPLNSDLWAAKAAELLVKPSLWRDLSDNAVRSVKPFTFQEAANGIIRAIKYLDLGA